MNDLELLRSVLEDAYDCIAECIPVVGWPGVVGHTGNPDWADLQDRINAALDTTTNRKENPCTTQPH